MQYNDDECVGKHNHQRLHHKYKEKLDKLWDIFKGWTVEVEFKGRVIHDDEDRVRRLRRSSHCNSILDNIS